MSDENDSQHDPTVESRAGIQPPSRRSFLKGSALAGTSGLMAAAGCLGQDSASDDDTVDITDGEPAPDGQVRQYTVHAIEADVVYNAFGLHQPNAAIYVLEENLEEALVASGVTPDGAFDDLPEHAREDIPADVRKRLDDEPKHKKDEEKARRKREDAEAEIEKAKKRKEKAENPKERKKARKKLHRARKKKARAKRKLGDVDTSVLEPLTIRANVGDVIEIEFVNHLDRHASIHQTALPYQVTDSDGMSVGVNPDTTAAPGETANYEWYATHEGTHFFHDGANPAFDSADEPPEEAHLIARGLFGSMVVEPPGATWTHPETGEELRSGVKADIHNPEGVSHREFIIHYHTPEGVYTADGDELTWPGHDEPQTVHAVNYRADPTGSRLGEEALALLQEGLELEDVAEFFYNSWLFGDPGGGDNVYRTYLGDPVKMVAVGASHEERHSHHLHGHRWKEVQEREDVDTIDAINVGMGATHETRLVTAHGGVGFFDVRPLGFGPGEVPDRLEGGLDLVEDELQLGESLPDDVDDGIADPLTTTRPQMSWEEAFEVGAGGAHHSTGDYLFHCHLFPHYAEGMWASMRVYDKEQEDLQLLDDNAPPLDIDDETPGFPDFVPGEQGQIPPKPPYDFVRDPTPEEAAALGDIVPGAPYTDPCDPDVSPEEFGGPAAGADAPTRDYHIYAVPAELVYNDAGDYDPEGQVFVLEEDLADVLTGKMNPEPLVIRANVGDCVDIKLTNLMPEGRSNHIHFVSYDILGSDALHNGYNYDQTADPGGFMNYRWYADEEGTIFFHDHINGIDQIMHGHFAMLIVEPEDSEWYDPHTGEPIDAGTQAIVSQPDGEDFREFALLYHDFAPLRERDGEFVNPQEEHNQNAGVMAMNYRNAPYYRRGPDPDPAYVHSSYVHGDPPTPTFEAYHGDPIRIHHLMGPYEEGHNLQINGVRATPAGADPEDTVAQSIHVSEAFTYFLEADADDLPNPDGLPVYDHLYSSGIVDDLWDGMWGINRVFDAEVDHLQPLPDRGAPDGEITEAQLAEMGHPAPFLDWEELGRRAWLTYPDEVQREYGLGKDRFEDWQRKLIEALERRQKKDDSLRAKFWSGELTLEDILEKLGLSRKEAKEELGIDPNELQRRLEQFDGLGRVRKPPFPPDQPARQNPNVGEIPPQAPDPGDPCPDDTVVREYNVTVFQTEIEFNEYTDHDPHGIVFALDEHVEEIRAGERPPETLVLRANEGDCIEINLTNELPADFAPDHAHPEMRTREEDLGIEWEESNRSSLHPQRLEYDVQGSDGATVGFNFDQTIAPGETTTYRWFADEQLDTAVLWDFADIRGHRHHGAFGRLIIEAEGATWLDPWTAEPLADHGDRFAPATTTQSIIVPPERPAFREFPLSFSDGRYIINRENPQDCVVPPGEDDDPNAPCNQVPDDPEDQGYMAINNRAEPFIRRFQTGSDEQHLVFSSEEHGDPATPVLNAFLDDPVRFRVHQVADKARGLDFHLASHQWLRNRNDPESEIIGVEDRFNTGKAYRYDVLGGAGGLVDSVGDHLYNETKTPRRLESGAWGIFRVGEDEDDFAEPVQPLPDRVKQKKLKPADRQGWVVDYGDCNGNGTQDLLIGVPDSRIAGADAGAAYLFYGPVDETEITDLSDADVQFLGEPGRRVGYDVHIKDGEVHLDDQGYTVRYIYDATKSLLNSLGLDDADEIIDRTD
ncbi:multicopper oxidase domain-containing protein [Natronorubrum sp. DTA28]|uniref:multicopper oxidase domain-containing protein n=1 Tax=Natronorubrum sp. DTA28 TaxID=3447019 RepID=UPI003F87BD5C